MKLMKFAITLTILLIPSLSTVFSQEDKSLLSDLETVAIQDTNTKVSTFKSSRLALGQSTEQLAKRELQFRVSHLFGRISDGIQELFGLDQMYNLDLSLEYGITDRIQVGLARSNDFNKTVQMTLKAAVMQQTAPSGAPVSITYFGSFNIRSRNFDDNRPFVDRLEYVNQLLVARRFTKNFSAQITPSIVYLNRVNTEEYPHTIFSSAIGASIGITPSININLEYIFIFPTFSEDLYDAAKNPLTIGVDFETGGHVFQVFITNATRLQPSGFNQQWDNDNFFKGDIHLGFSIMRSFNL